MLSVIREFVAPLSVPKLVILFVPIAIAPAIVPPAFARYAAETAVVVARSLRRVPPSWTTLPDTNVTTRPTIPVPVLDTILSAVREFVAPLIAPTPVMLLPPITRAPDRVAPAAETAPEKAAPVNRAYSARVAPPSTISLPVVPANTALRFSTDDAGPVTTFAATTPESAIVFPIVPEKLARFPLMEVPTLLTMLSVVRKLVAPAMEPLRYKLWKGVAVVPRSQVLFARIFV